jgi:hypothetical protein
MLVMTLRTEACVATCIWCSSWTASSAVVPSRESRRSSQPTAGVTLGSCSRSLCASWTAKTRENGACSSAWITAEAEGFGRPPSPSWASAIASAFSRAIPRTATPRPGAGGSHEYETQRNRQRPQLADRQRLDALVGANETA